jgi:hypothetical protein
LFGGEFSPFIEIVSGKQRILSQIHCFSFKIREKTILGPKKIRQKATIAYNMKGCLRFSIIIFWVSPNLANIIMNEFFGKKKLCHKFPIYKKFHQKTNFLIPKNCHNCLQYERVLKIFYFHILNIAELS